MKSKYLWRPRPEIKLSVTIPLILIFYITLFAIDTTMRKLCLPSSVKESGGSAFSMTQMIYANFLWGTTGVLHKPTLLLPWTLNNNVEQHFSLLLGSRTGQWPRLIISCEFIPNGQSSSVTLTSQSLLEIIQPLYPKCLLKQSGLSENPRNPGPSLRSRNFRPLLTDYKICSWTTTAGIVRATD